MTEATEHTLMQCPSPPQRISDKWQFRLFINVIVADNDGGGGHEDGN